MYLGKIILTFWEGISVKKYVHEFFPPVKEKILWVRWKDVTAGAVWVKENSLWRCVFCAPILGWMRSRSPEYVRDRLIAMGAEWEWLEQD